MLKSFDIPLVHHWIYTYARIPHRDISEENTMWRGVGGNLCGVLNDFDLASHHDWEGQTSRLRTGTRPSMSHGMHRSPSPSHLYRHDLEYLFYVLLITTCGHAIVKSGTSPLRADPRSRWQNWLTVDERRLYIEKLEVIFMVGQQPEVVCSFKRLQNRLDKLRVALSSGFLSAAKARGRQIKESGGSGSGSGSRGSGE